MYKTPKKDYIFFQIFYASKILSFRLTKICGLISPRAMSDSVKYRNIERRPEMDNERSEAYWRQCGAF